MLDIQLRMEAFFMSLGAWRLPFAAACFAFSIFGLLWLVKRRREGRPLGSRGFTLIEMAIVIAIIGSIAAVVLSGITPTLESAKKSATEKKLQRAELAILAYVMQNGCLPCPASGNLASSDANAGWSHSDLGYYGPGHATNSQPCAYSSTALAGTICNANQGGGNAIGVLPWRSLGITETEASDAWSSRLSYAVTSALAKTPETSMGRVPPASYPAGTLTVIDNSARTQTTEAAYVIISHGPDKVFAFAASSGATMPNGPGYVAADPQGVNSPTLGTGTTFRQDGLGSITGASHFDDIVRYRTAPVIIQDCGPNACGNPA